MPYTKQDLVSLGTTLRDTLASVGQTIKKNKLDAKKKEIMTKYKNPDAIMFDKSGASKSPDKIAETVFPDANWLISNGYINEANYLGNSFKEFNAQLNTREQNRAFIKSLPDSEQGQYKEFNLDRGNALAVHKEGRITKGGGYSGSQTKVYTIPNVYENGKYYAVTYSYNPGVPNSPPVETGRVEIDNMTTTSINKNSNDSMSGSKNTSRYFNTKTGEWRSFGDTERPGSDWITQDLYQSYLKIETDKKNGNTDGTTGRKKIWE